MIKKIIVSISSVLALLTLLSITACGPVEGKLIGKQYIPPYTETVEDYSDIDCGTGFPISVQTGSHQVYHEAKYYLTIKTEEGKIKGRYVCREVFDLAKLEEHIKVE